MIRPVNGTPKSGEGWLARRRQQHIDRAAQAMHDRLAASPESFRQAPSTIGITVLAVSVLVVAGGAVAAMVWVTGHAEGFVAWIVVGVGWLFLAGSLLKRPPRLPEDTIVLDEAEHPHLHQFVRDVAAAVGARPPRMIAIDTDFNAYVTRVGFRRRTAMVIGLPCWAAFSDDERLGLVGHELGHLRAGDTTRGQVTFAGIGLLARWHWMLYPGHVPGSDVLVGLATQIQRLLALPLGLLLVFAVRLESRSRQHGEYLADRRAAGVAGRSAVVSSMRLDRKGLHTAVRAAVIRGEDPFEFLDRWRSERQGRREAMYVDEVHRADASHPPDHLRVSLLERTPEPSQRPVGLRDALHGADRELVALRPTLVRRFSDELRETWW